MGRYAFDARVQIRAPLNDTDVPLELTEDMLPLRSVTVTNSLTEAGGRFTIELAPTFPFFAPPDVRLRSVAQLIKPMSLVTIALWHRGQGGGATPAPVPVMLGLIDAVDAPELWGAAEPERSVILTGRSLAGLLEDHRWWFHHYLALNGGIQLPPDVRQFFATPPSGEFLRDEIALQLLGFLAVNEDLFNLSNRSPVALMKTAYDFFVVGDPQRNRQPFIKVKFGGRLGGLVNVKQVPLAVRLRLDADAAQRAYFDQRSRLVSQFLPTQMPEAACWQLLRYFSEAPFNELFADTFGDTVDDAYVQIISRKPPWAGHIEYHADGGPFVPWASQTGRPPRGATLFDHAFGDWKIEEQTVVIGDTDVVATPQLRRSLDGAVSLYDVQPQIFANAGSKVGERLFQMEIPPIPDDDETSPSFIQRIGLRPLRVPVRSIATLGSDDDTPTPLADIRARALAYAALLYEWHFRTPDFWRGTYYLEGNTHVRIGRRLVDRDRRREFYVVAVVHRADFGEEGGAFTTTAAVTRGWDLVSQKSVTARAVGAMR